MHVTIIGNSIVANLGALYLRRRLPDSTKIVVVGPSSRGKLPLVGESLIEISTRFIEEELGLGNYLAENHYPKYALTYYFKLDPENPDDRTYSVHCNERDPLTRRPLSSWKGPGIRPPAWLINRHEFDRDMQKIVSADDRTEQIEGHVRTIELDADSGHTLFVEQADGTQRRLATDWIIDASGRSRVLGKKLDLVTRPRDGQRSCFWFWLSDFDRSQLKNLDALGPMPPAEGEEYHYDRYYTTHHFMGRNYWIWLIPIRMADNSEKISIGITWRPDLFEGDVRSVGDFVEQVERTHPVVTDLVRSGRSGDSHTLRNYRYAVSQAYSKDRWAIVGDAGFALDPLFSNGIAFSTIQLEQIGQLLANDCEGRHSPEYIETLDKMFWAPLSASQKAITDWYEFMHDPYLSSMRLHWVEVSYFYILLPMVVNRCHYDPERIGLWKILQNREKPFDVPKDLRKLCDSVGKVTAEHFIYRGKEKVNLRAMDVVEDVQEVRQQMAEGAEILYRYKRDVMARCEEIAERTRRSGS